MMPVSSRDLVVRVLLLTIGVVVLTTFFSLNHLSEKYPAVRVLTQGSLTRKSAFIEKSLKATNGGEYDPQGLVNLCSGTEWQEGVIFRCDGIEGGIGNVINEVLMCVRFAIEAGASLVIPKITTTFEDKFSGLSITEVAGLNTFFDREYFVASLKQNCPQLELINDINDLWDVPTIAKPIALTPIELSKKLSHDEHIIADMDVWRTAFDSWLNSTMVEVKQPPRSASRPVMISIQHPITGWPVAHDPPSFQLYYARILPFRNDFRRIAAATLFALSERFSLKLDPNKSIFPAGFSGAHLRTEDDAEDAGYLSYDVQASGYLEQARFADLHVIYVASGDTDAVQKFAQSVWESDQYNVTTKVDLLVDEDRRAMDALSWDQQSIIDWEVLRRAACFGGTSKSSFAWKIALERHRESDRVNYLDGPIGQTMSDEFSVLYGGVNQDSQYHGGMWP